MAFIGRDDLPAVPPNNPPEWTAVPPVNWTSSTSSSLDLATYVTDPEGDSLTFSTATASPAFPTGVTLSGTKIVAADTTPAAITSAVVINVKDDTSALIASNAFNINITSAQGVRAFPNAEGYAADITHGRDGIVVQVTNTNNSGAGSLREALTGYSNQPRIVVFTVSGVIALSSQITMTSADGNVAVFGQTAPGDGVCIRGPSQQSSIVMGDNLDSDFPKNVLFQHLRFRHGGSDENYANQYDNVSLWKDCQNVIFDHCSFTWHCDEAINVYYGGTQKNITFSRCIFGEGSTKQQKNPAPLFGHNYGPLFGNYPGTCSSVDMHHNYFVHSWVRAPRISYQCASGEGFELINNVRYNCFSVQSQFYNGSLQSTASPMRVTEKNSYFKDGLDSTGGGNTPFRVKDESGGNCPPMEIYLVGSTRRNIDDTAHPSDNTNNYASGMFANNTSAGIFTTASANHISVRPTHEITVATASAVYQDLIVGADVGATKPKLDSVDTRLINDAINGNGWVAANIVGVDGTGTYPNYLTKTYYGDDPAKPVGDTSGNGLPDYYQEGVLGIAKEVDYNPAATYTVGNGYTDIENWAHSI